MKLNRPLKLIGAVSIQNIAKSHLTTLLSLAKRKRLGDQFEFDLMVKVGIHVIIVIRHRLMVV
ncbi:MAG: hypothetical protein CML20_22870 [Rheinheimera sp.]|nr:hypothetical protein [Rheinheimera sp.]